MRLKRISVLLTLIISFGLLAGVLRADDPMSEDFVGRLYLIALGREADEAGLQSWTSALDEHRITGINVAYGFIYSNEYQSRDVSDDEYVELMYNMFFGRASDEEGKAGWLEVLASRPKKEGREELFAGFANSVEFDRLCSSCGIIRGDYIIGCDIDQVTGVNLFVDRLYRLVLGRGCDTAGMTSWTEQLLNGSISGTEAAYGFFDSPEYQSRNRTDAEYIDDLYNAFLGRPADYQGRQGWLDELAGGATRTSVFNGFAMSSEFGAICSLYGISRGDKIREANSRVVCLDPGHSGVIAPGYVPIGPGSSVMKLADASGTRGRFSGVPEYRLTLTIAFLLRTELENRGYTVIMTREDHDTPVDCVTRAQIANEGADISIRIHADALDNPSANGATAICITPHNPYNPQTYQGSRRLADCLIGSYCSATGIRNRGVSEQDDMTGNNWSEVPCVLFEMGFMTNQSDDLYMNNAASQAVMVRGLADGIDRFFAS